MVTCSMCFFETCFMLLFLGPSLSMTNNVLKASSDLEAAILTIWASWKQSAPVARIIEKSSR